jgi:hypothetical protein
MSTMPLAATVVLPTLADAVGDTLAGAFAGLDESCLWCGGTSLQVVRADMWTGNVTLRCPHCDSELDGTVERERREVRR